MNIRAGIDIGKDGGIVVFEGNEVVLKCVTPCIGNQIDLCELRRVFIPYASCDVHVVIEDVHAIFGSSAKSTFNFGWALGVIEGLLSGLGIPYTKVKPKEWQKEMWQGVAPVFKSGKSVDTKRTSLVAAKRLFPNEDLRKSDRSTLAHDGIVDALLMAEYCRRRF